MRDLTGQNTGTYGVSARRLNGTASCEVLIEAASVIRPITEAAEQDCFAFTGQAGETYNIELAGLSGFDPSIEVFRPDGTTVCGPGDVTLNSCAFDTTGTHQVIIRDRSGAGTGHWGATSSRSDRRARRTSRRARSPYGSRASSTRLSGVSAARRTAPNPPACSTSRSRASPAWVPSPARPGCDSEPGVHTSVEYP